MVRSGHISEIFEACCSRFFLHSVRIFFSDSHHHMVDADGTMLVTQAMSSRFGKDQRLKVHHRLFFLQIFNCLFSFFQEYWVCFA
jgi:hypothetical protein